MPLPFSPLPWQLEPWRDKRPTLVLAGTAGTGKSSLAYEKVNAYCMRFPGALAIVVRKYAESLKNSVIPAFEQICDERVVHAQSKSRFEYPNGSVIVYGGMKDEKQRQKLRSIGNLTSGADIALMEEANAFTPDDFDELSGRMRGKAGPWTQVILATNPDAERHWINQRFIRPSVSGLLHDVGVYQPTLDDNPTLRANYVARLDGLRGVMRERLRFGRWRNAEGAIYSEVWDPSRHIVEPFAIPDDWRRIRATDFGFVHARVVLWIAIDGDGCMYVYRQTYQTRQKASDSGREIIRLTNRERIEATIYDHDADERAELEDCGIPTTPANKQVMRGIQLVMQRLEADRLKFFRGCLVREDDSLRQAYKPCSTEEEFEVYSYAKGADGVVLKEQPIKENDHGMDTVRYAVMYEDRNLLDPAGSDLDAIKRETRRAQAELGSGRMMAPQRTSILGGGGRWRP